MTASGSASNSHREVGGHSETLTSFYQEHFWGGGKYNDELLNKCPSTRRDFRWTMDHIWIPRYPARGVKLPAQETEKPQRYITPEQAIAIEEKLTDPRHRIAWKLMLWAVNRYGEIRGLSWRSVRWEQNCILVTESVWEGNSMQPKTKNGYRKVVLTPTPMAELKKYKDENCPDAGPDDWLFPGRKNRPMDMRWLMSEHIKPFAEKLGIKGIHWHALRHLNNSLMLNEGVDVATRMDRLGHVSDRVNLTYSHSEDQSQMAASEAIERGLDAARTGLQEKRKAGSQAPLSLLSVTPNQGLPLSP